MKQNFILNFAGEIEIKMAVEFDLHSAKKTKEFLLYL